MFGTVAIVLAVQPNVLPDTRELTWISAILASVSFLLTCYFHVENHRYRSALMFFAVIAFCLFLPMILVLVMTGK